jgi:hypothetical protein
VNAPDTVKADFSGRAAPSLTVKSTGPAKVVQAGVVSVPLEVANLTGGGVGDGAITGVDGILVTTRSGRSR